MSNFLTFRASMFGSRVDDGSAVTAARRLALAARPVCVASPPSSSSAYTCCQWLADRHLPFGVGWSADDLKQLSWSKPACAKHSCSLGDWDLAPGNIHAGLPMLPCLHSGPLHAVKPSQIMIHELEVVQQHFGPGRGLRAGLHSPLSLVHAVGSKQRSIYQLVSR